MARVFSKPADGALVDPAGIVLSIIGSLIRRSPGTTFAEPRLGATMASMEPRVIVQVTVESGASGRVKLVRVEAT